ncbi:MAG: riboflavin synthase, partial [Acidobacteriota bacterium]
MFTGLVRECGRLIEAPRPSAEGGLLLVIGHSDELGEALEIGASLAVSGVCLTIVEQRPDGSAVELSPETLRRTVLGELRQGSRVNLEPAMRLGESLGGHWVQGHVDTTTTVTERRDLESHREIAFALPEAHRAH